MSLIETWDETKPAGSRLLNLGDDDFRELKRALRERLAEDHRFYNNEAGQTNVGAHNKVSLIEQASDPSSLADALLLYSKLAGSYAELFCRHENAGVKQLTLNGLLRAAALIMESEAEGDLLVRGASGWERKAIGSTGKVPISNGTTWDWGLVVTTGVLGSARNLKVTRPSNDTITVTLDEIVLEDSSNVKLTVRSLSETADKTTSGPAVNGRDQASAFSNSSWVYVWVISNGTTHKLILSASASAPAGLPSGYTYKAPVSAGFIDGSGNFIDFNQYGRHYFYVLWRQIASGNVARWTSVDMTNYVPSTLSRVALIEVAGSASGGITNNNSISTSFNALAGNKIESTNPSNASYFDIITANTLYYGSGGADAAAYCGGFVITII